MAAAAARRVYLVRRILVVDDDSAVCEMICDMLETGTFAVECVSSDQAAYHRLRGPKNIDALVVDVNLGRGTTGFDVARFARQQDPDLPVVYVTGDASEDSFRAFGVPGSRFVAKPFTADQLQDAVELALGED
jgi:CheY-like chemotaxis protein